MNTDKQTQIPPENQSKWFEEAFIDVVNTAMNKSISYDLVSVKKLNSFANKVIKVELLSTPFEFFIKIINQEVLISKFHTGDINTTIKGTPIAIFAMNAEEPIAGIRNVEIYGDANTGQFFAKWLKNLNPSWEEAWCDLLGDDMGVRASNLISGILDFGKKLKDSVITNTQEYLLKESQELITPAQMEEFLDDVDELKADTARLEQQIKIFKSHSDN
ncbi:hypothetical protein MNBD_GAMMA01-740 [hydrothermal vent metagenome]|uniref:Protein YigP (COG3165) clustered with ubiquinone biosynthetic genes n=1 Tax=hydrothermal vent metagenome TaxID=652676 RepID=A0A3B0UZ12_9ZZZZ